MNRLIDENGVLNIEDLLQNNASLQAILADNHITLEEKQAQFEKVASILRRIDEKCSDEEVELVRQLMAELSALIFICQQPSEE